MKGVHSSFMQAVPQSLDSELVAMPFVLSPASSYNIGSRQSGDLRTCKFAVEKELDLNAFPRSCVVDGPTSDGLCFGDSFTPAVERWWKRVDIKTHRDGADEDGFQDGLTNEYVDELRWVVHAN